MIIVSSITVITANADVIRRWGLYSSETMKWFQYHYETEAMAEDIKKKIEDNLTKGKLHYIAYTNNFCFNGPISMG